MGCQFPRVPALRGCLIALKNLCLFVRNLQAVPVINAQCSSQRPWSRIHHRLMEMFVDACISVTYTNAVSEAGQFHVHKRFLLDAQGLGVPWGGTGHRMPRDREPLFLCASVCPSLFLDTRQDPIMVTPSQWSYFILSLFQRLQFSKPWLD